MVHEIGPVELASVKTRVAFVTRMRFGGCSFRQRALRVAFLLRRKIESPRFVRVERFRPRSYGYTLKIRVPEDVDDELRAWFEEAHLVGLQEANVSS